MEVNRNLRERRKTMVMIEEENNEGEEIEKMIKSRKRERNYCFMCL